MTLLIIVGGVVLLGFGLGALLLLRLAKAADAAAEANARAEKAEADAHNQKEYADIGAQRHDAASTAGVLDEGRFFVPPAKGVLSRGTGEGRGRDQGEA